MPRAPTFTGNGIQRMPGGEQVNLPTVPRPAQSVPSADAVAGSIGSDTRHFALADHVHPSQQVQSVAVKTANYTILATDYFLAVNATVGNITLALPQAVTVTGQTFIANKVDASANTVTFDGFGAETINGAATLGTGTQYVVLRVISDGTQWWTT